MQSGAAACRALHNVAWPHAQHIRVNRFKREHHLVIDPRGFSGAACAHRFFVIRGTIGGAGRAPKFEAASAATPLTLRSECNAITGQT